MALLDDLFGTLSCQVVSSGSDCILLTGVISVHVLMCFFFFQAEDGIRDLVRSRGLGDVYKRQGQRDQRADQQVEHHRQRHRQAEQHAVRRVAIQQPRDAVSYTHLTLPTSDLV